jgi:ferredoxin
MMGLATDASLNPVAAASFIGEHSFSDEKRRIAQGRPDASDIGQARKFGRRLAEKVKAGDLSQPEVPGKRPEKKAGKMPKMASKATYDCDLCGTCMSVCPVGAIDGKAICDPNLCMACFACVKACPRQARKLSHPVLSIAKLALSKTSRKEPEIYV